MRWKVCWFALLLFCISSAVSLAAQSRIDCGAMNSRILKRAVRYCVYLPEGYDASKIRRYPLLYFLHGLGDNEQTLFNSGGWTMIDDLRHQDWRVSDCCAGRLAQLLHQFRRWIISLR
jgi:S-formylglutathione hydrolase FrmB